MEISEYLTQLVKMILAVGAVNFGMFRGGLSLTNSLKLVTVMRNSYNG